MKNYYRKGHELAGILHDFLKDYFRMYPDKKAWNGKATELHEALQHYVGGSSVKIIDITRRLTAYLDDRDITLRNDRGIWEIDRNFIQPNPNYKKV